MALRDRIPQGYLPELHNLNPDSAPPQTARVRKGFTWWHYQFHRGEVVQLIGGSDFAARVVSEFGAAFEMTWPEFREHFAQ